MATSYTIEIGYNSNVSDYRDVWSELKRVCGEIQGNPQRIVDEVLRLEPDADRETIQEVAERYRKPVDDLTVRIIESDAYDGSIGPCIRQSVSGGGEYRHAKESCRRAFCRLVLEEMHRLKMEVNVIVG